MDEDLTASHWDDVLAPSQSQFSSSTYNDFSNRFGTLNLDNPHKDDDDDEDDNDNSDNADENAGNDVLNVPEATTVPDQFASASVFNQSEMDQLNEIQREERKEKSSNLLTELTHGADGNLDESLQSPAKVEPSDSLFSDRGTPLKVPVVDSRHPESTSPTKSPTKSPKLKNGKFKATRSRRYPSKTVVKHLKEQNGDVLDPLGPLGGEPSDSTHENALVARGSTLMQEADAPLYDIAPEHEQETVLKMNTEVPKVSETARANDSNILEITVGDPVKVGDITNAHIVYSLRTRNKNEKSLHFPLTLEWVTVSRRYKDFRWIYHQLQNNHPGRIIPPPPTKQTYIGRFNENFIENRRFSLEKMLTKISRVADFADDQDFVMFLTSEDFANESKERERISGSGASSHPDSLDDDSENGSLSSSSSAPLVAGTAASSFMTSLFSISTKVPEPDGYFSKKKAYIEDLEHNLKTFYKSLELIATQRVEIIGVTEEIAATIDGLADLEILRANSNLLGEFAEVHLKLRENLDRVNLLDQLTLGFTIEEYLRIIGSVKHVFEARSNIYQQYITYKNDLAKKQESLDKLNSKYKSPVDKINMLTFEVDKLKQKVAQFEKSYNTISDTIKKEIDNFEMEKIEDFRNSVEIFIESSIESQKQSIELWETFYDRQNLALV